MITSAKFLYYRFRVLILLLVENRHSPLSKPVVVNTGLPVMLTLCAGFGVFATEHFQQGDFLLDYVGELLDPVKAYEMQDQTYIYYFYIGSKHYRY